MPLTAARRPTSAWCYRDVWERRPISPDQYAPLRRDARYGLCVVGDALDAVFAAMSDDTEGRRLDGHDDEVLRHTLQSLAPGRTWYLVNVVDNGDESPVALARAVAGVRQVAEAIVDVCPSIAGWRIIVNGAMAPASPVARAVAAAALALRAELECDVRVVDCPVIPAAKDRLLMELVRGTESIIAVRGDERLAPCHQALPSARHSSVLPLPTVRQHRRQDLHVSTDCAV